MPTPSRLVWRDSVDSTNDEARRLIANGSAADLLVVAAGQQSKGRGRRGRTWISPEGNLHCSVLIGIDGRLGQAAQLGFAAAAALVDGLSQALPLTRLRAKWPNDVMAETHEGWKKCAGMLLEPVGSQWLILGLGVDVADAPPAEGMNHPAVSLAELGYRGNAMGVLDGFMAAFIPAVGLWREQGFTPIRHAWLDRSRGLGEPCVVRLEAETVTGTFTGLDEEGALILDQPGQGLRRILAGDVFFPPV
ncbi:Biotin--(acetyl-CoA-carboxylase) ligase [Magnetospirillum sp. LM-5]|uniref:biotin--[acetyl-CoA-carboxylase] ligase n=1 Tax=Magnetospirillum sp. LM-5 TaxID=2681466 RepID=UPI0013856D86|nr:biotin--[acetyl-CoA-carboxylase] ligase [Magnetospirillum sp. LM-5]CAA7611816.1 Biotin--(acetyl-CoA-carboxylase) ligase [Magnetospirillum sp. LM-5]